MLRCLFLVCILSTLASISSSNGSPISNEGPGDKQLMYSIVVNRHGERAPDADELSLSDQQQEIKNLTYLEGPEGLTLMGKIKAYQIGKFYKKRYGPKGLKLISDWYIRDEIAIRSTDKERTKMTILVAMAAAYPPESAQQWDDKLGRIWQPVPYTAVPLNEDYLRYYSNCDQFKALMDEARKESLCDEFKPFMDLIPLVMAKTGRNFTEDPLLFQALFDLFRSTVALGLDIPDWAKPHLGRLGEAAEQAYRLYFRNDKMKRIGGGVLLDMFIEAADDMVSGNLVTQRLKLFSSHDFNLGALMEVSRVIGDLGIPEYGSVFALELYRSRSTGDYSVLPVYMSSPSDSSPKLLRIKGCESQVYCDYAKFRELTKEYRLSEKDFYKICNIKTEL